MAELVSGLVAVSTVVAEVLGAMVVLTDGELGAVVDETRKKMLYLKTVRARLNAELRLFACLNGCECSLNILFLFP